MSKQRIKYTRGYLLDVINKSMVELDKAPDLASEDQENFAIHYAPNLKRFDIATVKEVLSAFNTGQKDYRVEAGIILQNDVNFDRDYLMIELYVY